MKKVEACDPSDVGQSPRSHAHHGLTDPVLVERGAREAPHIAEVREGLATRLAIVPWVPEAPVGAEKLRQLVVAGG